MNEANSDSLFCALGVFFFCRESLSFGLLLKSDGGSSHWGWGCGVEWMLGNSERPTVEIETANRIIKMKQTHGNSENCTLKYFAFKMSLK